MKEKIKQYQGYFIIAILSFISIFFLPMLGSSIGLAFVLPNTLAGWLVWVISKLAVITINMLLFDQFVKQAKINIKNHPNFLEAERIFNLYTDLEEEELLAPKEYLSKLYKSKGFKVVASSLLSVVAFSNALLTFDWTIMLTYLFTIIGGVIYGWITMTAVESYWTEDYYKLAIREQKKQEQQKQEQAQKQEQDSQEISNSLKEETLKND